MEFEEFLQSFEKAAKKTANFREYHLALTIWRMNRKYLKIFRDLIDRRLAETDDA